MFFNEFLYQQEILKKFMTYFTEKTHNGIFGVKKLEFEKIC